MKFIHSPHRNRMMDFIHLPILADVNYQAELSDSEKAVCADILADLVPIQHFLAPFAERIKKYFRGKNGTLYIDHLYRHLLEKGLDPKNMEELYDLLRELPAEELKETYLYFLTDGKKTNLSDQEFFNLVEEEVVDESLRWSVFWSYHHLSDCIQGMIDFYKEALPLYLPYYERYAAEVENFSDNLDLEKLYQDANIDMMGFLQANKQEVCYVFVHSPFHLSVYMMTDDKDASRPAYATIYPRLKLFLDSRASINKDTVTMALKVLSDPIRYDILKLIYQDVQKHKDIAEKLGTTAANVSFHIGKVMDVGLFNLSDLSHKKYKLNKTLLKECLDYIARDFDLEDEKSQG
ncbi:hypothetical protein [Streptococcus sp. 20-1249]|uniref:hypothetical protein n=1 Tax=Streptococcus hepaticus TaxID=3349163 RepID=UPI0037496768